MFSLFNFSSIFPGGSADPICPYVRTPMSSWSTTHFGSTLSLSLTSLAAAAAAVACRMIRCAATLKRRLRSIPDTRETSGSASSRRDGATAAAADGGARMTSADGTPKLCTSSSSSS